MSCRFQKYKSLQQIYHWAYKMRLFSEQGVLFLMEGDILVHQEACASAKELQFATVMIMCSLRTHKVKTLCIEGLCIWHVTKRDELVQILLPLFED